MKKENKKKEDLVLENRVTTGSCASWIAGHCYRIFIDRVEEIIMVIFDPEENIKFKHFTILKIVKKSTLLTPLLA